MGSVFLGDVSLPPGLSLELPKHFPDFAVPAIANLEGPILELERSTTGVWNSLGVLDFLIRCRVRAVALANNHITDLDAALSATWERLALAGIASFGAGDSASEAAEPLLVDDGDEVLVLLGFGWEVIGCKPPCTTQGGVNLMKPGHVLRSIWL